MSHYDLPHVATIQGVNPDTWLLPLRPIDIPPDFSIFLDPEPEQPYLVFAALPVAVIWFAHEPEAHYALPGSPSVQAALKWLELSRQETAPVAAIA